MKPFRWDIQRKEQLGRLIEGERSPAYPEFIDDLRICCSKLVASCEDGYLVFVGRSPESIFDYLSGVFQGTCKENDIVNLNISNRYEGIESIRKQDLQLIDSLNAHLEECGLSPDEIVSRRRATVLTDLVSGGGTFGILANYLIALAGERNVSIRDLKRKLGFLGITWQGKTSPNTWRWQQKVEWVKEHNLQNIRNVSIPGRLWDYLGNRQLKVGKSNRPQSWASDAILEPPREDSNVKALRRAYDLYHRGLEEKSVFAGFLSQETAMEQQWFRKLLSELKRGGKSS